MIEYTMNFIARVSPVVSAVNEDDEEHHHLGYLPEDVEEEEVGCDENAEGRASAIRNIVLYILSSRL